MQTHNQGYNDSDRPSRVHGMKGHLKDGVKEKKRGSKSSAVRSGR